MGDFLFGSRGGVQTGSSLTPGQQQLADLLTGIFSQNLGQGATPYPGNLGSTDPNQYQAEAIESLRRLMGMDMTTQGLYPEMRNALSGILSDTGEVSDETVENLIRNPARRNLQEVVLPKLEESFAGPGTYWSSARAGAEQHAAQDTAAEMSEREAGLRYNTQQAAADRKIQALPSAMDLTFTPMQLSSAMSQTLFGMGTQINSQAAQTIMNQYNEWLRTQPENSPYLNMALTMLGIPFMYAFLQQPNQGALSELLAGIGAIMGGMPAGV